MKKTYNINICGVGFTIDDDAFTLLDDYLETLRHAFASTPDGSELMRDIEGRVAELLCDRPGGREAIITAEEVKEVIARIGQAEQFREIDEETVISDGNGEEEVKEKEEFRATPPPYVPNLKRKLYRDPNNRLIGGVCSGLAAYLNVDATWVRLATVALCFLSLSAIAIIYVILWIVVPEAETPLQQMQMRGEPVTMENIARTVTGENAPYYEPRKKNFGDTIVNIFTAVLKVVMVFIGVIAIPVIFFLGIGLIGCIVALIAAFTGWGSEFFLETTDANLASWRDAKLPLICAISWILTISLPLILLILQLISSRARRSYIGRRWRWALVIAWVISIIGAGVTTALLSTDSFRERVIHVKIDENVVDNTPKWQPDSNAGIEEFEKATITAGNDSVATVVVTSMTSGDTTVNTIKAIKN